VRIWRAGPGEAADVARLLAGFRDWMGRAEPSEASLRASVERIMAEGSGEYLLGARDDGPPLGVVQLRFRWAVWFAAEDCWLEDLFVAEEGRGSGLGRALAEAALARAAERGARRVDLDTDVDNTPARALYASLGFTEGPQLYLRKRF
jgi:ribosomal protein S18 acetylase RimI-like enzyme